MKSLFIILLVFIFCRCTETKQISNFKQFSSNHKAVALLPANPFFLLSDRERFKIGKENLNTSEQQLSFMVQQNLNKWFQKNEKLYRVSIQDIKVTNTLLFQSGTSFAQYKLLPKEEIAKKLQVDVVVFCNLELSKKFTDTEYDIAAFVGVPLGSQFNVVVDAGVVGNNSSQILWQKKYMPSGKSHEDVLRILERMLKTVAVDFPYQK